MKYVLLHGITIYERVISPLLHQLLGIKNACRYELSCSQYAKGVIKKYGAVKGSFLSLRRLLSCQPFFSI